MPVGVMVDVQPTSYDRSGKVLRTIGEPADYGTVSLSPDEKRLILERSGASNRRMGRLEDRNRPRNETHVRLGKVIPSGHRTGREVVITDFQVDKLGTDG